MFELTLNKRCNAPVGRVYAAWSTADQVRRWFAPGDMSVPESEVDFRVGGNYRIVMQEPDGQRHIVGGVYREIVENERIAFSWSWEGSEVTTEVQVHFKAAGEQTDLTLIHREFATSEARDHHQQGWEGCLANLLQAI
ncbi:MAG TPA: SRPBCC domain-containing protein [Rhodanobacter sp.]